MRSLGRLTYSSDGWASLVLIDEELGKYLRKLYYMASYKTKKLCLPSKGMHITIISPYEACDISKFGYRSGETLMFEILMEPRTNGNAVWYPVVSQDLDDLRTYFDLPNPKPVPLHLCIGYLRDGKLGDDNKFVQELF